MLTSPGKDCGTDDCGLFRFHQGNGKVRVAGEQVLSEQSGKESDTLFHLLNSLGETPNFSFDAATGEYSLAGIADTGEEKYKVSWTGRLTFLLEDKPVVFTKVLWGSFNPQNKAINLVLATDGISLEFNPDWNAFFYAARGR